MTAPARGGTRLPAGATRLLALALLLAPGTAAGGPSEEAPPGGPPPGDEAGKPAGKPSGDGVPDEKAPESEPPGETLPATVHLPEAGTHPAKDVVPLAARLTGRVLRLQSEDIEEIPVEISPLFGRAEVNLDGLELVLRAAGIHLAEWHDPDEGDVILVSRDPRWRPEPRSHTRIVEITAGNFAEIVEKIRRAVEDQNASLPAGTEPMVCVAATGPRKVFLSSPRKEDIAAVTAKVREIGEAEKEKAKQRPRLYVYTGRFRRVEELEEELLDELSPGERNLLRVTVTSRGNRLLFRCPESLWTKVTGILEKIDVRPKKEPKEPTDRAEKPAAE